MNTLRMNSAVKLLDKPKSNSDRWVKLICGASNEDIFAIEELSAIYAAAGVDYIDVAAEESIVRAARKGIKWAEKKYGTSTGLMISISDGKDVHFRKAKFDPLLCPPDCFRPCERICPTNAIGNYGIEKNKCYGCGRCIQSCPLGLISEYEYDLAKIDLRKTLQTIKPDAVEIHTEISRIDSFKEIANILKNSNVKLKKISVSCGLNKSQKKPEDLSKAFWERYKILAEHNVPLIWQLDGRPMSGDLSPTTGRDTVKLWEIIGSNLPPGLSQLAGGTNGKTHEFLNINNFPDGIAFGSYARKIMQPLIEFANNNNKKLYDYPEKMTLAIETARNLLRPWKVGLYKQYV